MRATKSSQNGSVFTALFGAVVLVGVVGYSVMALMKGPLNTAVKVTRQNTAESQMAIAAQVAVLAANAGGLGDCDSDSFIEPLEWRDPGASGHPTNGGLIPDKIVANKTDPWGIEYGYCAWDHGPTKLNAACQTTSGTNRRLEGTNSANYTVVAIVSAGPDKKFATTCRPFSTGASRADTNNDGDLDDVGDFPLVSKDTPANDAPPNDDIIFSFTYTEAGTAAGGLWSLKSSDADTAMIDKNIEAQAATLSGMALFQSLGAYEAPSGGGGGSGAVAPTAGLIHHWALDETSGTTISDTGSSPINGTWSGSANAVSTTGKDGTAFTFGYSNKVTSGDIDMPSGSSMTLSFWFKGQAGDTGPSSDGWLHLMGKSNNYYIELEPTGKLVFGMEKPSGTWHEFWSSSAQKYTGAWHHYSIGFTFGTGSSIKMWVDGQPVGVSLAMGNGNTAPSQDNVSFSFGSGFKGDMDDVRMYNRILTDTEADTLYTATGGSGGGGGSISTVVTSGLVGYWKMDEASAATNADSSGNGNNLTGKPGYLPTATPSGGKYSGATYYDVTASSAPDSSSLDLTSFTISLWAKLTDTGEDVALIEKTQSNPVNYYLWNGTGTSGPGCGFYSGSFQQVASSIPTTFGSWEHIVCTFDSTTKKLNLYVNGVLAGSYTASVNPTPNSDPLWIGYSAYWNDNTTKGYLDEVRLYNRAITPAEVSALYAGGAADNNLSVNDGIRLPLPASMPTCNSTNTGVLRRDAAGTGIEICNGTTWAAPAGGTSITPADCTGLGSASYNDPATGHCYWKTSTSGTWATMQQTCQTSGGYLATVNSATEQALINGHFTAGGWTYIGGSDVDTEGKWIWGGGKEKGKQFWSGDQNTGYAVNGRYTNWYSGEPNGGTGENCIAQQIGNYNSQWVDYTCGGSLLAFCEKSDIPSDVTSGIVGWWKYNEASGTAVADSSASANNATVYGGATRIAGKLGNAIVLDGVNDFVQAGANTGVDYKVGSLSTWVKPTGTPSSAQVIAMASGAPNRISLLRGTNGHLYSKVGSVETDTGVTLTSGAWAYVVLTWDNGKVKVYANGAFVGQSTYTANTALNYCPAFGAYNASCSTTSGNTQFFQGTLDDTRIYNRAITASEVSRIYEVGGGDTTSQDDGLIGQWKFNAGSGTTAADEVYANSGTLVNSASWGTGKFSGALSLSGANNQGVSIPTNARYDNVQGTWTFWYKTDGTWGSDNPDSGNSAMLVNRADATSSFNGMSVWLQPNSFMAVTINNATTEVAPFLTAAAPATDNVWHQVAITYDQTSGGANAIYIDGVLQQTVNSSAAWNFNSQNFTLGYSAEGFHEEFKGLIDDFRVYRGKLSAADIAALYTAEDCTGLGDVNYNDPLSGHCYYRAGGQAWAGAKTACAANGAYLATVTSATEDKIIQKQLIGGGQPVWIGGTDSATEYYWRWDSGPEAGLMFWLGDGNGASVGSMYTGSLGGFEPSDGNGGEDCMSLGGTGYWNDSGCSGSGNYICEKGSATYSIPSGLYNRWKFDEGTGTAVADSVGLGAGTLVNSPNWTDGVMGKALDFLDASKYVTITDPTKTPLKGSSTNFSFSAWVYPEDMNGDEVLLYYEQGSTCYANIINEGTLEFYGQCGGGTKLGATAKTGSLPTEKLSYVTVTLDFSRSDTTIAQFYVNGVNVSNNDGWRTGLFTNFNPTEVDLGPEFDGVMDDAMLFNRALSDAEVMQLYQAVTFATRSTGTAASTLTGDPGDSGFAIDDLSDGMTNYNSFNMFSGKYSGNIAVTGQRNTGFGVNSLQSLMSGNDNSAFGESALNALTTGSYNSAAGSSALRLLTSGSYNSALGSHALENVTGASMHNTAAGAYALSQGAGPFSYNTAIGYMSLYKNTTGSYNTATGYRSLYNNTTGSYNSAAGQDSAYSNTTGSYNTAFGKQAMYGTTTASYNTAFGESAQYTGTEAAANCNGLGAAYYNNATDGHCYYKSSTAKSWNDAQASCQIDGGYLATLNGSAESALLTANLSLPAQSWIGANDLLSEGKYRWKGGSEDETMFTTATLPTIVPSGLFAYWKFDEASGTSASDIAGKNLTLTGYPGYSPVFAPAGGKYAGAWYFNGSSSSYATGTASLNLSSFSISAWVKFTSTGNGQMIIEKAQDTNDKTNYYLYINGNNKPECGFTSGGNQTYYGLESSSTITYGSWQHLACTYDDTTKVAKIYKNGTLTGSATYASSVTPDFNTDPAWVGYSGQWDNFPANGYIDDLRVYSRALSAAEVTTLNGASSVLAAAVSSSVGGAYTNWNTSQPDNGGIATTADCTGLGSARVTDGATGHCYYRVTAAKADFPTAKASCEANGAYLATIGSSSENALFASWVDAGTDVSLMHWFGAQDTAVEGEWRWVTGPESGIQFSNGQTAVNSQYVAWGAIDPNGGTGENCGAYGYSGAAQWFDQDCTSQKYYICEKSPSVAENCTSMDSSGIWDDKICDNTYTYICEKDKTSPHDIVAVGYEALKANTMPFNTAVGYSANAKNTSGLYNTAIGAQALQNNTTGSRNTGAGDQALAANITGSRNTAIGHQALTAAVNSDNTAVGAFAASRAATTSSQNTAVGAYALRGASGAAFSQNTAIGYQALMALTTGSYNTAIGSNAANGVTTGAYNVSIGYNSMVTATGASSNNTVIGNEALAVATAPGATSDNTAIGYQALNIASGNSNTFAGYQAGYKISSGSYNTGAGYQAMRFNYTGTYNTAIGYDAGPTTGNTALTNTTAIGYGAPVTASNSVRLGSASVDYVAGKVNPTVVSDRRLKKDIEPIDIGLDFIMGLKPVSYRLKDGNGRLDYGFIAQDIEASLGGRKANMITRDNDKLGSYKFRSNDLIAPMVKAIQERQAIIDDLKRQIAELKAGNYCTAEAPHGE